MKTVFRNQLLIAFLLIAGTNVWAQQKPIALQVDATDAPRKLLHARMQIPARPGKLTLLYPKWIPGEHGPNGPITDVVGVKFSAGGKSIPWQRDADDMFAFHLD